MLLQMKNSAHHKVDAIAPNSLLSCISRVPRQVYIRANPPSRPSFLSQLSGESPLLAREKESEASRMIGDDEHSARGTRGPDTTAHARREVCEIGAQNGRKHDDDGEVQTIREIKRAARCDDCIISDIGSVWAAVVDPQLAFVCFPTPCGRAGCAGTPLPLAGGAYLRGSCARIASITCGGWYLRRRVHIIPALREALEAQPTGPNSQRYGGAWSPPMAPRAQGDARIYRTVHRCTRACEALSIGRLVSMLCSNATYTSGYRIRGGKQLK
ncbi:hypothetical protein B0H17DRAFT_1144404 [Mycena rosella]|uniref:Uncharacterized protein n=1 Tax=Mycena rosella TaxID=1033263 RepID=A0AAD7CWS7_MYCRO|nr:hypothetical protein B0H17DRAFT_1144404 [Mycena rosella]